MGAGGFLGDLRGLEWEQGGDVKAEEAVGRGIIYVVLIDAKKPWMLYDVKTKGRLAQRLGPGAARNRRPLAPAGVKG